jgi:integrase
MKSYRRRKSPNGSGSVKWCPSMNRIVGQVTRDGKAIKKIYGARGDKSPAQEAVVREKLRPFLILPAETDATATVQSFMGAYANRARLAPATRDCYRCAIKYLARLGAKRLIDVKSRDIRDAIDGMTGDPKRGATMARTRQIVHTMLHGIFAQAVKDRILTFNPVDAVEAPRYRREGEPIIFTPQEQSFLREAARGTDYEALLLLALTVPMRTCELLGLRRCDVNISTRKVSIRVDLVETKENGYKPILGPLKTPESRRDVPLSDEAAAAFSKRLQAQLRAGATTPEALIFTSPDGMPVRRSNLTRRWWRTLLQTAAVEAEKAARERGDHEYRFPVEAGLYDLRHSAVENLVASGVPMDVLHVLAGHANVQTTLKHYSKPSEERRRAAVELVGKWLSERAIAK